MAYQTPLTVKETLERVAQGRLVLPAIQREYVWVSDQERMTRLFDSLLRRYPIGTFLFWDVPAPQSREFDFYEVMRVWHERDHRHNPRVHLAAPRDLTAILDGQQRITTLNIGLHGSLAQRANYKRASSVDAYPVKRLYVDLLFEPAEDDDVEYRFSFLTAEQATQDPVAHWFRAGDVLKMPDAGLPILRYVQSRGLTERERPFEVLARLWQAVHQDGVVSAFEEKGEKLDRVLDIFVRVNSGGVVLSKSDLLLSMATAHFRTRDAREEIHRLVDELNQDGAGFAFSKDLVLKTGLVLTGISDIGFRVENFTAANMADLEANWDRLADALRVAVRLLSSFGLSAETLPASSVLVPLADYVYRRGLTQVYVDSQSATARADRRAIRSWTLRTILMPGVWGSGLDGLLRGLHRVIAESEGPFPAAAVEEELARRGKRLTFDESLVDDLLDTPYRQARTFALLTLLYETVDTLSKFHVDHVFPRALATRSRLLAAGVPAGEVDTIRDRVERLANLQLLHGPTNIDKRAELPAKWAASRYPDERARDAWLAESDLLSLPETFLGFLKFYDERRALMRQRLVSLLAPEHGSRASADRPDVVLAHGSAQQGGGVPHSDTEDSWSDRPAFGDEAAQVQSSRSAAHRPVREAERRSRRRFEESLTDLIADGRLPVGAVLHAVHLGVRHECSVERDGLRFDGRIHVDPTPAAKIVTRSEVNGWGFWRLPDGRDIGGLRQR